MIKCSDLRKSGNGPLNGDRRVLDDYRHKKRRTCGTLRVDGMIGIAPDVGTVAARRLTTRSLSSTRS
jgi:hypothetical protein